MPNEKKKERSPKKTKQNQTDNNNNNNNKEEPNVTGEEPLVFTLHPTVFAQKRRLVSSSCSSLFSFYHVTKHGFK